MAKLIKILAASVGGGLILGAGIRLGEAIATFVGTEQDPDSPAHTPELGRRLGELESRLQNLEGEGGVGSRVDARAQAMSSVRSQIKAENRQVEAFSETSLRLRGELQGWLEESVAMHLAEVEARLKAESERGQKQMLDVFVENVQTRVIQRISQLEEEVAGQSAAMSELRECSLRTERSIQKLLDGLDRLVVKPPAPHAEEPVRQEAVAAEAKMAAPALLPSPPTPFMEPAPVEAEPRPSRWKIFG